MHRLNLWFLQHRSLLRLGWLVALLVLAACQNNGSDGGGGGY
jgi:hypothetical protein